ncbi:MAG: beta-lactamase family protein, partial [Phenylobacterium sp.]|nr:beta-lactamase family protein [Phenylobacterium sp.]
LNRPHGVLDTTTPAAMAGDLKTLLLGAALTPASRRLLEGWMVSATPGLKRLRAGFPPSWKAGDKSGTGRTYANDIAIVRPAGRAPLLVAAYYEAPAVDAARREDVLRQVGAAVAAWAG